MRIGFSKNASVKFVCSILTRGTPEIYQKLIDDIELTGLPPRGSESFDQALIARYALDYAARGWAAIVTVDDNFIRVVAVPEHGIEPKAYVLGLLKHGFLEDALPILEALSAMVDDADIEYNLGICLSELGRIEESVAPLERCITLDPNYVSGLVGLGVAYVRLNRLDEAEALLRRAIGHEPQNVYAKRNLAVVLTKTGRLQEALPLFRQVASLAPKDPNLQLGLAQCLMRLGGAHRMEAGKVYRQIIEKFREHTAAELAVAALNKIGSEDLHAKVDGKVRMDAVFYMQSAMQDFAVISREQIGKIVLEIALLGQSGLKINEPDVRYTLANKAGDFSGLQLISIMHVGIKQLDPEAESGTGLDREYELATGLQK